MIHAFDDNFWVLETRATAYAFGLDPDGRLVHSYWGQRLPRPQDYPRPHARAAWASFNHVTHLTPEEFPVHGGPKYIEPCLFARFADGTRDVVPTFVEADTTDPARLRLRLRDAVHPLVLDLTYEVHEANDLIGRSASVTNEGDTPTELDRIWSAQWHVPEGRPYHLTHLTGRWLDEFNVHREPLVQGVKVLESRRLTTSHHHSPWFALDAGEATEDTGSVWFGSLAWSGNWKLAAETTDFGMTRISLGVNDWDFVWRLAPGETFTTPVCVGGYTTEGFGGASRRLHDFVRDEVVPHPGRDRPVLYNSWEATLFDVDEDSQARLAEVAADLGVELFVMDDGWFHRRDLDNAGLGDWWPDARKFPRGLTPLIDRVGALGMTFGLWLEPEMVNPDSDLYRAHPDWVIHFESRERTEMRGQLILNLAREDVQAYLIGVLDELLRNHDIRFVKWDMNRNVSEPGWPGAPREARELWVRYVHGLYHVWGTLAARHPHVTWQSCSGGGGRADLGILRLADQVWISDNTHAAARLAIQDGYSRVFPASTMEAWVTDADRDTLPLRFRMHVSMLGLLGIGGHLGRWTEEERAVAREEIARYKSVRDLVQWGDQYRLRSASTEPFSAVQYVSKSRDRAVLFAFRTHVARPTVLPPLYLRGLDPQRLYEVEGTGEVRSGAAWANVGLRLSLNDFESTVREIREVTSG